MAGEWRRIASKQDAVDVRLWRDRELLQSFEGLKAEVDEIQLRVKVRRQWLDGRRRDQMPDGCGRKAAWLAGGCSIRQVRLWDCALPSVLHRIILIPSFQGAGNRARLSHPKGSDKIVFWSHQRRIIFLDSYLAEKYVQSGTRRNLSWSDTRNELEYQKDETFDQVLSKSTWATCLDKVQIFVQMHIIFILVGFLYKYTRD
jgi:hypothetical protein